MFGGDYPTVDGTGVRDFIHVVDLAIGHVKAMERINGKCGCCVYNLGTGIGYSVLEMVKAMEEASGRKIAYRIVVCYLALFLLFRFFAVFLGRFYSFPSLFLHASSHLGDILTDVDGKSYFQMQYAAVKG